MMLPHHSAFKVTSPEGRMGQIALPAVGAQARRKRDGILGEVYSIDPPHNILSVRWATVPGSYGHEDCTTDQFSRRWELTGIQLQPPRETHVALGLIALIVLVVFCGILVHNARSYYVGYDPFRPNAAQSSGTIHTASALNDRFGGLAATACAAEADNYIRSITQHRFHWNEKSPLEARFDNLYPKMVNPGVLTLSTSKPEISNGFGDFTPITVYCNFDTENREVLGFSTEAPVRLNEEGATLSSEIPQP
jgi:hypothetical protein